MAYAERRGDYYRGRYKNPPGVRPRWGTVSEDSDHCPFTRKRDAERAAEDKESEIRGLVAEWRKLTEGRTPPAVDGISLQEWRRLLEGLRRRVNGDRDPGAGEVTLRQWVEKVWWPAQDLAPRTVERYGHYLNQQIYPHFGERPINSLTDPQEFGAWEVTLRQGCSLATASGARSLLSTILGDAKDARLLDDNAAGRRRGRGRKNARGRAVRAKTSMKVWATPLEALVVAERCALLTGQDDDFVMWVTCAWTGMRWAELIGLELGSFRLSKLFVEWQLGELGGGIFAREDPKDSSFRNDQPGSFGAVDLPPFLSGLLSDHVKERPPRRCRCGGACGSTGRFLFLGPRGGHHRRSDYNRRAWHPAVDGAYPAEGGKRPRPARPVLADAGAPWPGVPLRPAWPYAAGEEWAPPRGQGWTQFDAPAVDVLAVGCGCGAGPREACASGTGKATLPHRRRRELAERLGHVTWRAPWSWLPLKPGLTPHGLRHSHKVWMDEDGIPDILKHDRLGHSMPGIGGTYSHVSPAMRETLKAALQGRWETALRQRAALSPHSAVPLLHALLTPHRETYGDFFSRTSPNHAKDPLPLRREGVCDLRRAGGI